ncbi:MAG: carboxypeptidase-like regulatory domain-containing protein [Gemmatimonadaceae bacterium]|nr:carboxypeptidase-like regulatory domain-containing protein [Gemmatimonadaceae bacterium]
MSAFAAPRVLVALACTSLLCGCAASSGALGTATLDTVPTQRVVRDPFYPDSARAAADIGVIAVAVRELVRPERGIPRARAIVTNALGLTVRERLVDTTGVRVLDSIPAGVHTVEVRHDGYGDVRLTVPVAAGCRVVVEAYLAADAIGGAAGTAHRGQRGRATVTSCGRPFE